MSQSTNRFISYVSASNPGSLLKPKYKLVNSSKPTSWPLPWLDCLPQENKLRPPSVCLIPKGRALGRHLIYNFTSFNFFGSPLITQVIHLAGTAGCREEFISSSFSRTALQLVGERPLTTSHITSEQRAGTRSRVIQSIVETGGWGGKCASPHPLLLVTSWAI